MSDEPKLKRLKGREADDCSYDGGYRGERDFSWRPRKDVNPGAPERINTELAVRCRCGVWWGWASVERARKLLKRLRKSGCPRCKRKGTT